MAEVASVDKTWDFSKIGGSRFLLITGTPKNLGNLPLGSVSQNLSKCISEDVSGLEGVEGCFWLVFSRFRGPFLSFFWILKAFEGTYWGSCKDFRHTSVVSIRGGRAAPI